MLYLLTLLLFIESVQLVQSVQKYQHVYLPSFYDYPRAYYAAQLRVIRVLHIKLEIVLLPVEDEKSESLHSRRITK